MVVTQKQRRRDKSCISLKSSHRLRTPIGYSEWLLKVDLQDITSPCAYVFLCIHPGISQLICVPC